MDQGNSWTDAHGRRWHAAITVSAIKRVKNLVGVDLLDVFDGQLLNRLADDPVLLANTLYAVCKPQADEEGVSDEAFGELLVGDTIEQAATALVQGLTGFFPQGKRAVLTRLWAATTKARTEATKVMTRRLDPVAVDQVIQTAMKQAENEIDQQLGAFGSLSGSLPESLASTPAP
jgi:hypothetical protein